MQSHRYISAILLLFLGGCFSEPEYSNVPEIGFKSIQQYTVLDAFSQPQGGVEITITFQDGDGNLGLDLNGEDADNPDFDDYIVSDTGDSTLNKYRNNYFIDVYRREGDAFQLVEYPDESSFSGVFPHLSDSEKEKPIEGDLEYTFILLPSSGTSPLSEGDVVKFQIQIADRDLQESNIIESDTITVIGY